MNKRFKADIPRIIAAVCAVLVVAICSCVLFANGGSGLSDNGDFQRVMDANGISPVDSSHSRYLFKRFYTMEIDADAPLKSVFASYGDKYLYKSCHSHFIKLSKFLNYCANLLTQRPPEGYDIFFLGFIYVMLLAVAAFLIVSFFKKPLHCILASSLFILLFCDSGYILYFNSLYGEAAQFVSLMLIVGLVLTFFRKGLSVSGVLAFCVAVYWFGGSKLANIPFALLIAVSCLVFVGKGDLKRSLAAICGVVSVCALLIYTYVSIPPWMNEQTTFQSVFFGILKESPTPSDDLEELGLAPEYASLAGSHAYLDSYPIDITSEEFKSNFYDKISKTDTVLFYAKHPVRFIGKCAEAIRECVSIGPVYLGTSPHHRMAQPRAFSLWSRLRGGEGVFTSPYIMLFLLFALAVCSVFSVIFYARKKSCTLLKGSLFFTLLLCGIWANLLIPIAGNGDADLLKHMYLFIHLTDIALCFIIMSVAVNIRKSAVAKAGCVALSVFVVVAVSMKLPTFFQKTVTMGVYNQTPVEWIYSQNGDGTATLISKDILFKMPFDQKDQYGSNLWAESDLRTYLNGEFLNCFTEKELSVMLPCTHKVTLSADKRQLAESGSHPPYWRASRFNASDMHGESFMHTVTDMVYLPDTVFYSNGLLDKSGDSFYLIDPYGSSNSMVRFIDKNGIPLYCDASYALGIRPVITISEVN